MISAGGTRPPGQSTLPVIWNSAAMAWPAGIASRVMSMARPHCSVAGFAAASMRAARTILSSGIQVIAATRSAGYSCTRSFSSSKP